ncbi:hypothetical protein K438DRAFT_2029674 [Mycena galopus ATCC 62051]|nr:hypothetical protein K438DRAFT_2029674 [Mycena galopus ATCC 62051]
MSETDAQNPPPAPLPVNLPDSGHASWLDPDCVELLEYLVLNKAAAGDGGNFKMVTFRGAAAVVNKIRTKGGPKTAKSCQNKYGNFKKIYELILRIMEVSGWTWTHEKGVNVIPGMEGTWDAFVARNPGAEAFRNKGWPYFDSMASIMPEVAKGTHVFRPTAAPAPRAPSPDWDMQTFDAKDSDDGGDPGGGGVHDEDVDGDVDDEEEARPSPVRTPSVNPRKRTAAQSTPVYTKKPHTSAAAQALSDLAASAGDLTNLMGSFRDVLAAPVPATGDSGPSTTLQLSPQRRTDAIKLAQQEQWLVPMHRLALIKLLRDVKLADEYNTIKLDTEEMRVLWVQGVLQDVGVYAFHPTYSFDVMNF